LKEGYTENPKPKPNPSLTKSQSATPSLDQKQTRATMSLNNSQHSLYPLLSQSAHSSFAPIKATRRCTSICPAVAPFSQIFPFPHQIFPLTPEHPLKQQMPAIPYFPHRQLREK